eukprot:scaffold80774_cov72-Phaeocystis_antarctica.AAC.2
MATLTHYGSTHLTQLEANLVRIAHESAARRPAPRAHRLVAGPQPDTISGPQQHAAPPAAAAAARAQQHAGRGAAAPGCHDARRPDRHALMHQAKDSREQRSKAR